MKITINRATLANALAYILPFAPQKSPIYILRYAKITAKGTRLKLEANDRQASVRRYLDAVEIDQDGSFLVDCADISAFIARCKGDNVTFNVDGETLTVSHPKGKAEFQVMAVDEYPSFDMPSDGYTDVTLTGTQLYNCINTAKNFVGSDDLRPTMKAIYAYVKDGEFGYCATDTCKMVCEHNSVEGVDGIGVNWYIEPLVFSAIANASKCVDAVNVKISDKHVYYRIGNTVIQTLQTQGAFPDFKRVIPKSWGIECHVDKDELVDSLKRVSLSCDISRLVKLHISQMDMTITADNLERLKSSTENIQHNGSNGDITIGFNVDNLLTHLAVCGSGEISLRFGDSSRPMMVHQAEKPNAVLLQMPMNINR